MSTRLPAAPTSLPPAVPTPATSVEVVTQLGTSVVSIDHLGVGAAKRGRGRLCVGLGAALLAGATLTFGAGLLDARADASAREEWVAKGKPVWAFRPTRHSGAADVAALGGALAGLGLVATGLLRRREQARTALRVGQNDNADIPVAGAAELTLVDSDGQGGFRANLTGLTGEVRRGSDVMPIESLLASGYTSMPLAVGTHVKASLGSTTFHVRGVETPARSAAPVAFAADRGVLAFVAASAVVHLGVLAILNAVPPSQDTALMDMSVDEDASIAVKINGHDEPIPPPVDSGEDGEDGENGRTSEVSMASIEDGTLGTDQPNPTPAKLKVVNRNVDPQLARRMAIEAATSAGVLGAINSPIAVFEGGSIASGFDDIDITGGIIDGGGTGAPAGSFGWGIKGNGIGCGTFDGKNCGGINAGPYATVGWTGDNYGGPLNLRPGRPGRPGDRVAKVPTVKLNPPITCTEDAPCLDKEIIRRYVKRNIEKITYCYEKELLANPGLEGTVTVNFILSGNGRVMKSEASGVDATVSSCIAGVVSNIQFPKVGDAGIYPIKYPFTLRPSGR
jgi:hypothetical protein